MLETWRDVESYRTAEGFGWEVPRAAGGPKKWGSQLSEPGNQGLRRAIRHISELITDNLTS